MRARAAPVHRSSRPIGARAARSRRRALRMDGPVVDAAHRRGSAAGIDHGGLQLVGRPAADRVGDDLAGRVAVGGEAEGRQGGAAVAGRVRVQPDPPVGGGVVAGDRIPHGRQLPPVGTQRRGEPRRGEVTVDHHVRRRRVETDDVGDRLCGECDRLDGEAGDGEGRREGSAAGELGGGTHDVSLRSRRWSVNVDLRQHTAHRTDEIGSSVLGPTPYGRHLRHVGVTDDLGRHRCVLGALAG